LLSWLTPQATHLFFVVEFCAGGELFYHFFRNEHFSEDEVKVYFGEILLALHQLHRQGILYRDLKPENILLDLEGHVKLADFGLATYMTDELKFTFCGSYEYMAPEMIKQEGYDLSLDFYSLGVLIYELVSGIPPFYSKNRKEQERQILSKELKFPGYFSSELKSIIS